MFSYRQIRSLSSILLCFFLFVNGIFSSQTRKFIRKQEAFRHKLKILNILFSKLSKTYRFFLATSGRSRENFRPRRLFSSGKNSGSHEKMGKPILLFPEKVLVFPVLLPLDIRPKNIMMVPWQTKKSFPSFPAEDKNLYACKAPPFQSF